MSISNSLTYLDFTSEHDMRQILPANAIVSSEQANWQSLHLKYYRYNAHEISTNASQQHVVIIQTDVTEVGYQEMVLDGETRQENLQEVKPSSFLPTLQIILIGKHPTGVLF